MKIHWIGHACFLLTSSSGTRIITDPYDNTIGYRVPNESAHVVTSSHDHFDHGNVGAITGNPRVLEAAGASQIEEIRFTGVLAAHDEAGGSKRGKNVIFVMEIDGMRVVHLGDLGHPLEAEQLRDIGKVDVLFIPVGGIYTVETQEAWAVVEQLKPRVVVPMHFKTARLAFDLAPVEKFTAGKKGVRRLGSPDAQVEASTLPGEQEVWVLTPSH